MTTHLLRSLRWRLPLSYAGIALLTALTLGASLLLILRAYYQGRERLFLEDRATAIGAILQPLLQDGTKQAVLKKQVEGLAFLAQVRVQLLDKQAQPVADSRTPPLRASFMMSLGESVTQTADILLFKNEFTRTVEPLTTTVDITSQVMISINHPLVSGSIPSDNNFRFVFQAPAPDLFLPEPFNAEMDSIPARSSQQVKRTLQDTQGNTLGYVLLGEGPAYGRQIVTSATWAVFIASLIATVVAAGVGWWVSRQLSEPLLQLTDITSQMAAGHLSVRAAVRRADEIGILAHSFNEMAQQVEETVKTLRQFVADAAHELNTPITALRTNLELSPPTTLLQASLEQVVRLETLVKNLLLLARLEATPAIRQSNPAPNDTLIDLVQLLHLISEPFASRAEQREISFTVEITNQDPGPLFVVGNEVELTQAVQNLLDNALKFTEAGGAIRLMLSPQGAMIQIAVEDTGIGVPPDEVSLLFQRFYRARNAAAYPGNGLGLAIVKAIAERHGGRVAAEGIGRGICFRLSLPRDATITPVTVTCSPST